MQVVAHNLPAQFTNRQLNITTADKAKSAEKLSSGYRINRAADDAAGLGISETMRWQIRGLDKGSSNTEDGMSLLQVADGALAQVHSMLDRVKELSVQAANDTNTPQDRQAIQKEINQIILEIDRIGDDTEFNTMEIFQGGYTTLYDANGNPVNIGNIPISDLRVNSVDLRNFPFNAGSSNDTLNLNVSTVPGYSPPQTWHLIYGDGNTSRSALRVTYNENGNPVTANCKLNEMTVSNVNIAPDGSSCERTFTKDFGGGLIIDVVQKIEVGPHQGDAQDYQFTYTVNNRDAVTCPAAIEFLFNADTAYNNNDRAEQYFLTETGSTDGKKVDNFCVYTGNNNYLGLNSQYIKNMNTLSSDGFSISSITGGLPFSQKLSWTDQPDTLVIGRYGDSMYEWDRYNNLRGHVGGSTANEDIAFSMIWEFNDTKEIKFNYGIMDARRDPNLTNVPINFLSGKTHTDRLDLWIQSGALQWSGQFITIGEMNSEVLGINKLDVTSHDKANQAIAATDKAIDHISAQRSLIGAQTNRLEHTKMIDDNTSENTQAAESRLRDTDMAEEMVDYSKHSILEQAGEAMLAQANQMPQGILNLLF